MNLNCSACNIKIDINSYKKIRAVGRNCYDKSERKNHNNTLIQNKTSVSYQQPKMENSNNNNNNRTLLVGPSFLGKSYLMLKNLSRLPD